MLKTVVLLNIFVETVTHFVFIICCRTESLKEKHLLENKIFYKNVKIYFDQFNASLLNKSIHFFKNKNL